MYASSAECSVQALMKILVDSQGLGDQSSMVKR